MKTSRIRIITVFLASLYLSLFTMPTMACGTCHCHKQTNQARTQNISVHAAWLRHLPDNLPAAGYMTIHNHSARPVDLLGASSPDYTHVMLHQSILMGTMSKMVAISKLSIPAHGKVKLAPHGYHLMLENAKHAIAPGDTVQVQLKFSNQQVLNVTLPVKPAAQMH